MPKKILLFLLVFFTACSYAQNQRQAVYGKITDDSTFVKDIHIFNINSRKGTISNTYGEFSIPVKENDTLFISGLQYNSKKIIIDKNHLQNLQLYILLTSKINELSEVEIKEHELTGNLTNDAKNAKNESKMSKVLVDPDAWKVDLRIVDDIDEIDREKAPDSRKLTDPIEQSAQGSIIGLLGALGINALITGASKIGKKKRVKKRAQKIYEQQALEAPDNIRNELGDSFFTETLKISPELINGFITHCDQQGIIDLYLEGNKMLVIDILVKESKLYLKKLEDEE